MESCLSENGGILFSRSAGAMPEKNFPAARSVPCPALPGTAPPSFFRIRNILPRFFTGGRGKESLVETEIGFRRSFPQLSGSGNRISCRFPRPGTGVRREIRGRRAVSHRSFPKACGKTARPSFPKSKVFHSLLKLLLINVKEEKSENPVDFSRKSPGRDVWVPVFYPLRTSFRISSTLASKTASPAISSSTLAILEWTVEWSR